MQVQHHNNLVSKTKLKIRELKRICPRLTLAYTLRTTIVQIFVVMEFDRKLTTRESLRKGIVHFFYKESSRLVACCL